MHRILLAVVLLILVGTPLVSYSQINLPYSNYESLEQELEPEFTIPWIWTLGSGILSAGALGVGAWQLVRTFQLKKDYEAHYDDYVSVEAGMDQTVYDSRFEQYKTAWEGAHRAEILSYVMLGIGLAGTGWTVFSLFYMENRKVIVRPDFDGAKVELSLRF
jgi:hypothetical protein